MNNENLYGRLTLDSSTFFWYNDIDGVIYNSNYATGFTFRNSKNLNKILNSLNLPESLYSVVIYDDESEEVFEWVNKVVKHGFGTFTGIDEEQPFSIKPILKIQNSIQMLKYYYQNGLTSVFRDYIHRIVIDFGDNLFGNDIFAKQIEYPSCNAPEIIDFDKLELFIEHSSNSLLLSEITLVGIPVVNFSLFIKFICNIRAYHSVKLVVTYRQAINRIEEIRKLAAKIPIVVMITLPCDIADISYLVALSENITACFVVQNEADAIWCENNLCKMALEEFHIRPVFNGSNQEFISSYLFVPQKDILNKVHPSKKEIFINESINLYDFGVFYISADGTIKTNPNDSPIGNIDDSPFLLVAKELITGHSWLRVRNKGKCNQCNLRFLCPPYSHYEHVLNIDNLCTS